MVNHPQIVPCSTYLRSFISFLTKKGNVTEGGEAVRRERSLFWIARRESDKTSFHVINKVLKFMYSDVLLANMSKNPVGYRVYY